MEELWRCVCGLSCRPEQHPSSTDRITQREREGLVFPQEAAVGERTLILMKSQEGEKKKKLSRSCQQEAQVSNETQQPISASACGDSNGISSAWFNRLWSSSTFMEAWTYETVTFRCSKRGRGCRFLVQPIGCTGGLRWVHY